MSFTQEQLKKNLSNIRCSECKNNPPKVVFDYHNGESDGFWYVNKVCSSCNECLSKTFYKESDLVLVFCAMPGCKMHPDVIFDPSTFQIHRVNRFCGGDKCISGHGSSMNNKCANPQCNNSRDTSKDYFALCGSCAKQKCKTLGCDNIRDTSRDYFNLCKFCSVKEREREKKK
jgi:hypothetical protein